MKINPNLLSFELLQKELLTDIPSFAHSAYIQGYQEFVNHFFQTLSCLYSFQREEVNLKLCFEQTMNFVNESHPFQVEDIKDFHMGSIEACQRTLQMLELAYSETQAA